MLVLIAVQ